MSSEMVPPEVDSRTWRALTESMTVLPEGGDIYTVVGENGNGEYSVDTRESRCTCADYKHREVTCKHQRRVAYATGERPIPGSVPRDAIDELLGAHTDEPIRIATPATAGEEVVE